MRSQPAPRDNMLPIAQAVVRICAVILWVGIGALLVALPFLYRGRADMLAYLGREGTTVGADALFVMVAVGFIGIAAMLYFGTRILRHLLGFVRSVSLGDPFIADNALRLRKMAWLTVAVECSGLALWFYERAIERYTEPLDIGFSVSMGGIIAVVTLFVLARIFAIGAEMRDDLEGTV